MGPCLCLCLRACVCLCVCVCVFVCVRAHNVYKLANYVLVRLLLLRRIPWGGIPTINRSMDHYSVRYTWAQTSPQSLHLRPSSSRQRSCRNREMRWRRMRGWRIGGGSWQRWVFRRIFPFWSANVPTSKSWKGRITTNQTVTAINLLVFYTLAQQAFWGGGLLVNALMCILIRRIGVAL